MLKHHCLSTFQRVAGPDLNQRPSGYESYIITKSVYCTFLKPAYLLYFSIFAYSSFDRYLWLFNGNNGNVTAMRFRLYQQLYLCSGILIGESPEQIISLSLTDNLALGTTFTYFKSCNIFLGLLLHFLPKTCVKVSLKIYCSF
jgi:hypothetical protein